MAKTLVGAFDDADAAQSAIRDLQAAGIRSNHMRMMSSAEAYGTSEAVAVDNRSWADKVSAWFSNLFDSDDDRVLADDYAEAYRRGHYLVVVDVEDDMVDSAIAVMNRYGNVDLTKRAEQWRASGYKGFDRTAQPYTADQRQREIGAYKQGEVLPVVQEELSIGKRVVQRGGVRVHSYVQDRPVEELVRLREEKIDVQRRPVDRAATEGDLAFKDRTVDVTAVGEEPVVAKKARVVEEVVVGKHVEQREQKVRENVRRKDVSVEPISSRRGNVMPDSQRH